jgi:hypothetical protein
MIGGWWRAVPSMVQIFAKAAVTLSAAGTLCETKRFLENLSA